MTDIRIALASSFADPDDVAAYHKAIANGLTHRQALAVGDNGIGAWGHITAQTHTPMVALAPSIIRARWAKLTNGKNKRVQISLGNKTVIAQVADVMPEATSGITRAGIDLNPAASRALALRPPHLVKVEWKWLDA